MSAPKTNIRKQTRHHLVPIVAIIVIVAFTIIGFFWWVGDETDDPEMPAAEGGAVGEVPPMSPPIETLPGGALPGEATPADPAEPAQ